MTFGMVSILVAIGASNLTSWKHVVHEVGVKVGFASSSIPSPVTTQPCIAYSTTGTYFQQLFGWAVADAGDVNGDGFDDFIIGDPRRSFCKHEQTGGVLLYET